jgi:hypothetical protein
MTTLIGQQHPLRRRQGAPARGGSLPLPQTLARLRTYCAIDPETECWHWTGSVDPKGRPRVAWHRQSRGGYTATVLAARTAYTLAFGPLAYRQRLYPLCPDPRCIAPLHWTTEAPG